ncbi:MAG: hypothetical protein D6808_05180 [Candidatus Dadabacteria bacterium]|nr:MAG: hypothetical protein D6808_05180 [Candidatus Dadabacteria bacterium]
MAKIKHTLQVMQILFFTLPFICLAQVRELPDNRVAHLECVNYLCQVVNTPGPNKCLEDSQCGRRRCENYACKAGPGAGELTTCTEDAHCDTECQEDGQGTGILYGQFDCGPCTGGACSGKQHGSPCKLDTGGKKIVGTCVADTICSSSSYGGFYAGACGMRCLCTVGSLNAYSGFDNF